ncbi:TonB-dependent receptor [Sphingomonas populi]|uniref:TonB-dependent receptor n=1 Tax=Sphingomonas populi TaxID=2484750 RepID=A0A4Q6XU07_9SPHN|nr:TonB-dependent receptor [Sphingomonas populi]RZF61102.1 TonB-dependent receptor [Sphingomonas populi]
MKTRASFLLLCGAAAPVLVFAPTAFAADAAPPAMVTPAVDAVPATAAEDQSGDIVVTAQQRRQRLIDAPVPVTVLSGETLKAFRIQGLGELSLYTPGLLVQEQSVQRSGFNLRGITQDDSSPVSEPTISIFVDGIDNSRQGGAISELLDVNTVQVIRGPQGTLFGRGSVIGVIAVESNRPTKDWSAEVSADVSTLNGYNVTAIGNAPIVDDTVMFRTAWRFKRRDGDAVNVAIPKGRLNGIDTISGRSTLRVKPVEAVTSDLIFTYQEDHPPATEFKSIVVAPAGGDTDPFTPAAQDRPDQGISRKVWGLTWDNQIDLSEHLKLRSFTGYRQVRSIEHWDGDGTGYAYIIGDQNTLQKQYSEELRATWTPDPSFTVIAGGNWFHEKVNDTIALGINEQYLLGSFPSVANRTKSIVANPAFTSLNYGAVTRDNDRTSWSGYVNASKTFFNRLTFDVGLRYTYDDATTSASAAHRTAGGIAGVAFAQGIFGDSGGNVSRNTATFGFWTPRGAVSYKITPNLNIYAGVAKGTRSGVVDASFSTKVVQPNATWNIVKPEEVMNYEAGIKAKVGRINADLTLYKYNYTNLQVRDTTTINGQLNNAGKADGKGVEVSVRGPVLPGLNVIGSYAYNDSGYTYYVTSAGANLSGNQFRLSPHHKVSLAAKYEHAVTDSILGHVRVTEFYQSKTFMNADNLPYESQGGYALTNFGIGLADDTRGWSAEIYVNNLFDKNYLLDLGNTGKSFGLPTAIRGEPRIAGIRLQQSF